MKEEKLCIEDTKLDQKLLDGGVRFLPWIGKDYDKGLSYDNEGNLILGTEKNPGKKILVLLKLLLLVKMPFLLPVCL